MTPRQLLDTLGPRDREPIYCVTARGKTGGAYSRTFRGRNAAQDAEWFRLEQESYGCVVTVEEVGR